MTDINNMTPDELRALADKREKEEQFKVYKTGYAKENMYCADLYIDPVDLYTETELSDLLQEFEDSKECVIEKGALFECLMPHGKEEWFDTVGGYIEGEGEEWAEKYLENIKDVDDSE